MWKGGIKAAAKANFLGLGIGQFKARFSEFYRTEAHELIFANVKYGTALSVHNDYLAILVDSGLPGVFCYVTFLFLSFVKNLNGFLSAKNYKQVHIYQFNLITVVSIIIFGITMENFLSPLYWMLLAISTKTPY